VISGLYLGDDWVLYPGDAGRVSCGVGMVVNLLEAFFLWQERRKRNPEVWNKPRGKPGRKPGWNSAGASRLPGSRKRAGVCPDGALPRQPGGARVRRATESNVTIADIVQQAAAVPSAPPTRTYIRPHQVRFCAT
jgi:hypothetical protein